MRRAMAEAEVGDDYYGEDPTVRLLEEETAAVLGKEAALFVPSGCMGNEIAIAVQTDRGDAILLDRLSHVAKVEAEAVTGILGRRFLFCDGDRGRLSPTDVAAGCGNGSEAGRPRLVEVENTHNWGSGSVYPLEQLRAVAAAAKERRVPVHLDGARLWNASAATGVPAADYAVNGDSVMVCYSKGLGAPAGSAIAGSKAFVREARRVRKVFGGAMRQAGILAAGGLHGLRHHRARLAEDHARARRLAEAVASTPGLSLDPAAIETNILIAEVVRRPDRFEDLIAAVKADGVLLYPFGGPARFRCVTHLDVDDAALERAVAAIRRAATRVLAG
ncbi:MAG: aminotransferase class I/II-fold pyridoxal phosphate-dependent enzyme [Candidatus Latescibacteria bacterium]|nr:aminotransferase class I/II-fold pyridoxal phosphate-dependent enzyme [Candidatus Latescibacterota bacterium]